MGRPDREMAARGVATGRDRAQRRVDAAARAPPAAELAALRGAADCRARLPEIRPIVAVPFFMRHDADAARPRQFAAYAASIPRALPRRAATSASATSRT